MSELEARGPKESEHEAIISAYGRGPNYGRYIDDIVGRLELYGSVLARQAGRKRENSHQYETEGPNRI